MSLMQSVLEKYGGLTDKTDKSPSVSSGSGSPRHFQGEKGTSVSSVSTSDKHLLSAPPDESTPQKRAGDSLTKLTQVSDLPHIIRGIWLDDLKREAGSDWEHLCKTPGTLDGYARNIAERRAVLRGEVPPDFTTKVICLHCGEVWMPPGTHSPLNGCLWCLRRLSELREVE